MAGVYLDSSAIVKLVNPEPESAALRAHLRRGAPFVSSALARTEVVRAVLHRGEAGVARARAVLERMNLVRVNDRILAIAAELQPATLRSLDAIHLATALDVGGEVGHLVTYDDRMGTAAELLGMRLVAPS